MKVVICRTTKWFNLQDGYLQSLNGSTVSVLLRRGMMGDPKPKNKDTETSPKVVFKYMRGYNLFHAI